VLLPTAKPDLLPPSPLLSAPLQDPSRNRILAHLAAFAVGILLAIVFTLPGSLSPNSALLGYPGDNFQHAWFLWHFARAVARARNPFYTNLLFYPNRANLAWSTTDPLAGTLALPLSFLVGPVSAYNLSLVLQLALSAFFARLLCLKITRDEVAALFGGALFGFSPFFLAHALGHLSLVTAFPIPLFVLLLDRIFTDQHPSRKLGVLLGSAMFLAALAHYDYAVLCLLVAFFWLVIDTFRHSNQERFATLARVWKPLLVAAATFLVCFSPLLVMLVGSRADVPISRGLSHVGQFSADALGFLVPSWNHVLLGHLARHWDPRLFVAGFEGTVYFGLVALALAILAFWTRRSTNALWAKRALLLGLIFYLLSLGPVIRLWGRSAHVPGPAALFYLLPFARFFSAPARFQAVVALCLAILCSLGVKFLLEKYPKRSQRIAVVALLAVLLLCDYLTVPFPTSSTVDPAAVAPANESSHLAVQACTLPPDIRGGTVLTFPLLIAPYCMKSMWMQVSDGGRYALIDGYLSYTPQCTWRTLWTVPILRSLLSLQGMLRAPVDVSADANSASAATRDLNLSAIVVFDSPGHDAAVEYIENAFAMRGERAGSCTLFRLTHRRVPLNPHAPRAGPTR
jgi:hypothetical protein